MQPLSIVVPTFNGATRLPALLGGLRSQEYDQGLIELIVVDDDSSDLSREVAASYGARVLRNGSRSGDTGKTIGIDAASHDLVLLLDDDNYLPHAGWLRKLVDAYVSRPSAAGAQCAWFDYRKDDPTFNRFCSLFGVRDPLVYYLGRQDHLRYYDERWPFEGVVVDETMDAWTVRFRSEELPTVGAQGFLTRKSLLAKIQGWHPTFYHIDACYELTKIGFDEFVIVRDRVGHWFGDSLLEMLIDTRKCTIHLARTQGMRTYRYETNYIKIAWAFLKMLTLFSPFVAAIRMYQKTRDVAAFLHPIISFCTAAMHLVVFPVEKARVLMHLGAGKGSSEGNAAETVS